MSDMKLSVVEIKELMDKMAETGLTALRLRDGEFALTLKKEEVIREVVAQPAVLPAMPSLTASVLPAAPAAEAAAPAEKPAPEETGKVVKSPIVGTFYAAAAPEKPPFVTVGQTVAKGDVLFIIESMKLMNEVQSEFDGTVKKILVENGQGVEYGQPILVLE